MLRKTGNSNPISFQDSIINLVEHREILILIRLVFVSHDGLTNGGEMSVTKLGNHRWKTQVFIIDPLSR